MNTELAIAGAKLIIQTYFSYMRIHGKTLEESKALFIKTVTEFDKNDPTKLEDV